MEFPSHESIESYTGFLLRKVSSASFQAFSDTAGEYGLHPMHFGMLTIVNDEEPISQQELGRRIGVDPSTMVGRMDVLDQKGLVERTRGTEDRRSYEIRLSPEGRRVLKELRKEARELRERLFEPLTAAERRQLHELLAKVAAHIDDV